MSSRSSGRQVRLTARMQSYLEELDQGNVAAKRKVVVNQLKDLAKRIKEPNANAEDLKVVYLQAMKEKVELKQLESEEKKVLSPDEKETYEVYYGAEEEDIETSSKEVGTFLQIDDDDDNGVVDATRSKCELLVKDAELQAEKRKVAALLDEMNQREKLHKIQVEIQLAQLKLEMMQRTAPPMAPQPAKEGPPITSTPNGSNAEYTDGPKFESIRRKSSQSSVEDTLIDRMENAFQKLSAVLDKPNKHTLKIEPDVFQGDILAFSNWRQTFQQLVESEVEPDRRIIYLLKYTKGEPHESVNNLRHLEPEEAYDEGMKELQLRYGNSFQVYNAYRAKLTSWPSIKEGDGSALRKFADFLGSCSSTMKKVSSLKVLDDVVENTKLVDKLPRNVALKWGSKVDSWQEANDKHDSDEFPPFEYFVTFVKKEARIACGPIMKTVQARADNFKFSKPAKVYATGVREEEEQEVTCHATVSKCCNKCNKPHNLEECSEFVKMSLTERHQFARVQQLCRCCLQKGHYSRGCTSEARCSKCNSKHHILFHDDDYKPRARVRNDPRPNPGGAGAKAGYSQGNKPHVVARVNMTSTSAVETTAIIPVTLTNAEKNVTVKTYGILDIQSDSCFITDDLADQLQANKQDISIILKTMAGSESLDTQKVSGITLTSIDGSYQKELPSLLIKNDISGEYEQIATEEQARQWEHLAKIADKLHPVDRSIPIDLLVGRNCLAVVKSQECIPGADSDPCEIRTNVGWTVVGQVQRSADSVPEQAWTYCTSTKEVSPAQVAKMFAQEFQPEDELNKMSVDDVNFIKVMDKNVRFDDNNQVVLPLPLRDDVTMPDNSAQVRASMESLKRRLLKDERMLRHYREFMAKLFKNNYAELAPDTWEKGMKWLLMQHGVYHPQKLDCLRVVFNASKPFRGICLNQMLLQGPDQMNNLLGILCRFRLEPVAITCDIESMFYRVRVEEKYRDLLRFYWWPDGDLTKPLVECRMLVHAFGVTSSPGVTAYALKHVAKCNRVEFGDAAADFVEKDFYVDDGLKALPAVSEAIDLMLSSRKMCGAGGFNLTKFASNVKEVIAEVPMEARAKNLQSLDLSSEQLPMDRSLGVGWDRERDMLVFMVEVKPKPCTRRGVMSTVSSIYDPIGLLAPFLLGGKIILQEICTSAKEWDEPLTQDLARKWLGWREQLDGLKEFGIPRCIKDKDTGEIANIDFHHFSDASMTGYGQCSYIRMEDTSGKVQVALIMGKARVTPNKSVTVPRLELAAAVVSTQVAAFLQKQLPYKTAKHYYYSDSQVVLGYISNPSKRFHIFVANRVQRIRESTTPSQWYHVATKENPADLASRGVDVDELLDSKMWFAGPRFLWNKTVLEKREYGLVPDDPEVRKVVVLQASTVQKRLTWMERIARFSSWNSLCKAVAVLRKRVRPDWKKDVQASDVVIEMQSSKRGLVRRYQPVSVDELNDAERFVILQTQMSSFHDEYRALQNGQPRDRLEAVLEKGKLRRLDPFLASDGLLRLGGRLREADLAYEERHPVLLDKDSHAAALLLEKCHKRCGHGGREATLHSLRENGIWITNARRLLDSHIHRCIPCRRYRAPAHDQRMADLPWDRLTPGPPFTQVGMDFFGPFKIKRARSLVNRFVAMYTCHTSRAVHLEPAAGLSTDDFMNTYHRFVARRGPVKLLRCDQGTNFVGALGNLTDEDPRLDIQSIKMKLREDRCEMTIVKLNTPKASHTGGTWERKIRVGRDVLNQLLEAHSKHLDEDAFHTLVTQTEMIMNSRPLAGIRSSPDQPMTPLSPATLLTMKPYVKPPKLVEPVERADLYLKNRWKRVQFLAEEFWNRWRKEFLPQLQKRSKWAKTKPNLQVGDVVLLIDEGCARCDWPLALVTDVQKSRDGLVRSVTIKTEKSSYQRPVTKLIPLITKDAPSESQSDSLGEN